MEWEIPKSNLHLAGFSSSAVFNLTDLASEIQESLHCQICHRSLAAKDWAWQRLESKAHATLNPNGIVELGVDFRCFIARLSILLFPSRDTKPGAMDPSGRVLNPLWI